MYVHARQPVPPREAFTLFLQEKTDVQQGQGTGHMQLESGDPRAPKLCSAPDLHGLPPWMPVDSVLTHTAPEAGAPWGVSHCWLLRGEPS